MSTTQTIWNRQQLMDSLGIRGDLLRKLIAEGLPRDPWIRRAGGHR